MLRTSAGQRSINLDHTPYVRLRWAKAAYSWIEITPPPTYPEMRLSAIGFIEVENVSSAKQVSVHHTSKDGWVDTAAKYVASIGNNRELWSFDAGGVTYPPYFGSTAVEFVVMLTADGTTTWDNNGWRNYVVYGPGAGMPESSIALGQDNLRVTQAFLYAGSSNDRVNFDVRVTVKNIAYQKEVLIVYSTDNWQTVQVGHALWNVSYGPTIEGWQFFWALPPGTQTVVFAVAYSVDGNTYWDNNDGLNYNTEISNSGDRAEDFKSLPQQTITLQAGSTASGAKPKQLPDAVPLKTNTNRV